MTRHVNRIFEKVVVDVDGEQFIDCIFRDCTIRYSGGPNVVMQGCDLSGVMLNFSGAAGHTIALLREYMRVSGEDGDMRRQILNMIGAG